MRAWAGAAVPRADPPPAADLLVVVPSRGRPESLPRLYGAWRLTRAFTWAALAVVVDSDDPTLPAYTAHARRMRRQRRATLIVQPGWQPMVSKLNAAARALTAVPLRGGPDPGLLADYSGYAVGFAGDDHFPRTPGWPRHYLHALRDLGTGIVYGDDLIQGAALPTQWAMTSDIVRALGGRMVPAPVGHFYCDNAVGDLGREAGCLQYLPDVVIEHLHPTAGTAPWDETYAATATPAQDTADRAAYEHWRDTAAGLAADAATVRALRR